MVTKGPAGRWGSAWPTPVGKKGASTSDPLNLRETKETSSLLQVYTHGCSVFLTLLLGFIFSLTHPSVECIWLLMSESNVRKKRVSHHKHNKIMILHSRKFTCQWTRTEHGDRTNKETVVVNNQAHGQINCGNLYDIHVRQSSFNLDTKLAHNKRHWPKMLGYREQSPHPVPLQLSMGIFCCEGH